MMMTPIQHTTVTSVLFEHFKMQLMQRINILPESDFNRLKQLFLLVQFIYFAKNKHSRKQINENNSIQNLIINVANDYPNTINSSGYLIKTFKC